MILKWLQLEVDYGAWDGKRVKIISETGVCVTFMLYFRPDKCHFLLIKPLKFHMKCSSKWCL